MKLLHIINTLNTGGAEKLLVDSLPLYELNGITTDLLLLTTEESPFLKELRLKFSGNIFISKYENCYSPLQILEIKKYIKNYNIVHVHLFPALYWTAIAKVISRAKPKLVFTEHSTINRRLTNFWFRQMDKVVYSTYNKIIAITPEVKSCIDEKLNLKPNKVQVVYNGVSLKPYEQAKAYPIEDFFENGNKILIQVARFQYQKDQITTIKALSMLPQEYKLLLVGDGEKRIESEELVRKLELTKRVKFLGVRSDVAQLLKTAHIVVQSSIIEGFGLTAVEGMASGKPVVASNVPGLKEVVESYGLVFAVSNASDLVKQILFLEEDENYNRVVKKCIERAASFKIEKMIEENISMYNNLLL